jgi:hypothetical protein
VPLVHELAYYLASPSLVQANVKPGQEFAVELPLKPPAPGKPEAAKTAAGQAPPALQGVEVIIPSGQHVAATAAASPAGARITFAGTYEPGLYHLVLPPAAGEQYVLPPSPQEGLPFVVLNDAEEGRMAALTDADYERLGKHVKLFRAQTTSEMAQAVADRSPGEELSKYLAVALLIALLAEIGLARWIATQRGIHKVETVTFGQAIGDMQTLRQRARSLLALPNQDPDTESKA